MPGGSRYCVGVRASCSDLFAQKVTVEAGMTTANVAVRANACAVREGRSVPAYSALTRCALMLSVLIGQASVFVSCEVATMMPTTESAFQLHLSPIDDAGHMHGSHGAVTGFETGFHKAAVRSAFRSRLGLFAVCFVVVGPVFVCVCVQVSTPARQKTMACPWARSADSFGHERGCLQ